MNSLAAVIGAGGIIGGLGIHFAAGLGHGHTMRLVGIAILIAASCLALAGSWIALNVHDRKYFAEACHCCGKKNIDCQCADADCVEKIDVAEKPQH
jgi:hypothetical protein